MLHSLRFFTCLTIVSVTTIASAADPATSAPKDPSRTDPLHSWRYPSVVVPQGPAPLIDGQIAEKGEYSRAAKLTDFVVAQSSDLDGQCASDPTEVYLTYTNDALHVAFRTFMPEGVTPVTSVTEGHDKGMSDDAFEIFLSPGPDAQRKWHIGGNAAGVCWDREFEGMTAKWDWNPKIRYKAKIDLDHHFWAGEFEIPWAELGQSCPVNGAVWRANFYSNRRNAPARLDAWSYSRWNEPLDCGYLVFGGDTWNFFRMRQSLTKAYRGGGAALGVMVPPAKDPNKRKIEYDVTLLVRDPKQNNGTSFYSDFASRRRQATGEGATWASFKDDLDAVLKTFTPVEQFHDAKLLPDGTGPLYGPGINVKKAGDYLLHYEFRDVTDAANTMVMADGTVPFRILSGVQVTANPYLLTRQSVILGADLRAVEDLKSIAKLHGYITAAGDTKPVREQTVDRAAEGTSQDVEVSAKDLPAGSYDGHVDVLDLSGKVLSHNSDGLEIKPLPDWWVNRAKYMNEPEVPAPWTPVEYKDGVVKVWGRETTFGDGPLPAKIVNQGKDVLAAPMQLELKASGQLQSWKTQPVEVSEQRPGHILHKTSQEAARVRVRGEVRSEFDGFSLIDLYIEPTSVTAADIDSLDLVMPVRAEQAQFLTNHAPAPGPGNRKDIFGGVRYVGKTPDHYESQVTLTTWLGNDDGGLELSTESSRDWSLGKPNKAIQVDKNGDVVEARFHLIDHAIKLDKPRHIRFGLIATPTKPVTPERLNWRIDALNNWPVLLNKPRYKGDTRKFTQSEADQWEKGAVGQKVDILICQGPEDWSGYRGWARAIDQPDRIEGMGALFKAARDHGMRVGPWGGWGIAPFAPEWKAFGKEMVAHPLEPTYADQYIGSYGSPYVEFLVGSFAANAKVVGASGIRFDTVVPWRYSANPYLGEAWISDTDGQTYGTQNLFRQREMLKGMYRVFHGGVINDGFVYLPVGGPPLMCVESFEDIHEIGEGKYMKAASLKEGYAPDEVRVWMTGRPYGFITSNNTKGNPLRINQRNGALLVHDATPRVTVRAGMNSNSYDPDATPTTAMWNAFSWVDRGTAKWHPYWSNKDEITSSSSAGNHYTSFYLQPGKRILLVTTSYEKVAAEISVLLKPEKLGFPADVKLEAQDAVTGEVVPISANAIYLSTGSEMYRLVKIAPAEELHGANLDRKH